ncbi:MAG TPA: hypothetical protein ENF17_02305 [Candidatus Aminicenantes bacterium]|nr:hypothetical protein [Candidatus Aminicenantes bacterium]
MSRLWGGAAVDVLLQDPRVLPCQASGGMRRVDARGASAGCPPRQVVFTVPKMLRLFFRFKRKLLNSLCLYAVSTLVKFLRTATGLELMPGVVAVIQTFGDRINFHPHIHVLVTEGGTA